MEQYSLLISVYLRCRPDFLNEALDSIYRQTCPPSEIVIVKDGPVTLEMDRFINMQQQKSGFRLVVIQLERNVGLGDALQAGLQRCSFPIVARMDSDDIAAPSRCEKQLRFLQLHRDVDVVGSWIAEFEHDETQIYAHRIVPTDPIDMARFAKQRNPLNHMTVMFRRASVLAAGGYVTFHGFEDYYLWIRLLLNGSRLANIPEYLVNARAGEHQILRRGGLSYALNELRFQREMLRLGFTNPLEFTVNSVMRFFIRMLPVLFRRAAYQAIRRIRASGQRRVNMSRS
ncbi:MAG TPA: glycosyltransferase [Burkholderiales bacterium]|nr:glycosyltransferase [Burkholderiales bacterium]